VSGSWDNTIKVWDIPKKKLTTPAPTTVSTPDPTSTSLTTKAVQNEDSNKTLPIVISVIVSLAVIGGLIYYLKKKGYIYNKFK
jgi:WD40 repeat protein